MQYQAVKSFLYQGQPIASGDAWEPTGHRNDAAIIRARMVVEVDTDPKVARATAQASKALHRTPRGRKAGA